MDITILGGGHGAYAAAASLAEQGHRIRFWRRDAAALAPVAARGAIRLKDSSGERAVKLDAITADLAAAVRGAELIVIPLPATAHAALAAELAPHLEDGQVVFLPPGTFGSYVMARAVQATGRPVDVSFAETGTLPYLARKHGPDQVTVSAYATRLPTGVFPARNSDHAFAVLQEAYPAVERLPDALSGALMNAGPIIHPPLIIMNAAPLEHFPAWDIHNEGTQASVRRVTDQLDAERMAIREALGYQAPHFPLADHYRTDGEEWMYGNAAHEKLTDSGDWREKIDLVRHRYMLEDVEQALAFLVSCADYAGVSAGVARGLLSIGAAIVGRDFRQTGRTLENLGLAGLDRTALQTLLHDGLR